MKFEYLKEFIAAAQAEEMQLGAKEMGISSSVLSKHIKTLEQELGVPLFEHSRKTQLSKYGVIFLQYVKRLVNLQNDYLTEFANPCTVAAELTVGISPDMFKENYGHTLEQLLFKQNGQIKVIEADNSLLSAMVENGTVDIAFVRSQPVLQRNTQLVYMPFSRDRMMAVVSPDHRLAKFETVHVKDLKNETVFLHTDNSIEYKVFSGMCLDFGVEPKLSFASTYTVYQAVRSCDGITLSCSAPADNVCLQHPLTYIPVEPEITSFVDIVFRDSQLTQLGWELIKLAQDSAYFSK